jgi:hypothetical protein
MVDFVNYQVSKASLVHRQGQAATACEHLDTGQAVRSSA